MERMQKAPGDDSRGLDNSVGTTVATIPRPDPMGTGLRGHRASRWAKAHLDAIEEPDPARPPEACPGWHPGPCLGDYWGMCSGMHLTVQGREALAELHPWRVDA